MTAIINQATDIFRHESYQETNAFMYESCFLIGANRIQVLVFDKGTKEHKLLRQYPCPITDLGKAEILELNEILGQLPEADLKFSRFHILIEQPHHNLVPDVFFEKNYDSLLYNQTNEQGENEELHQQKMPAFQSVVLFPFQKYLTTLLNSRLKSPRFIHHSAALMYGAAALFPQGEGLLMNYNGRFATIIYLKNKLPQFVNSFVAETDNDALYFLLATMEEFAIAPTSTVMVSGDFSGQNSLLALFGKYLHQVHLVREPVSVPEAHRYFAILSAARCE